MNRRGFLRALAAAVALPAVPGRAIGAAKGTAATVAGTSYTYGLAVFHARTRSSVTAAELAARTGVTPGQAARTIERLLAERHIVPGALPGSYTAANPYLQNPALREMVRTATAARRAGRLRRMRRARTWPAPDLSRIVTYLRELPTAAIGGSGSGQAA